MRDIFYRYMLEREVEEAFDMVGANGVGIIAEGRYAGMDLLGPFLAGFDFG